MEVADQELLIGGMKIVVGQAKTHHYAGKVEVFGEVSDDRDGSSGSDEDGVFVPDFFES